MHWQRTRARPSFAIIPFACKSGTSPRPIYINAVRTPSSLQPKGLFLSDPTASCLPTPQPAGGHLAEARYLSRRYRLDAQPPASRIPCCWFVPTASSADWGGPQSGMFLGGRNLGTNWSLKIGSGTSARSRIGSAVLIGHREATPKRAIVQQAPRLYRGANAPRSRSSNVPATRLLEQPVDRTSAGLARFARARAARA